MFDDRTKKVASVANNSAASVLPDAIKISQLQCRNDCRRLRSAAHSDARVRYRFWTEQRRYVQWFEWLSEMVTAAN